MKPEKHLHGRDIYRNKSLTTELDTDASNIVLQKVQIKRGISCHMLKVKLFF